MWKCEREISARIKPLIRRIKHINAQYVVLKKQALTFKQQQN